MAVTEWTHPTVADTGDDWSSPANATEDDTTTTNPAASGHFNDWTSFKNAAETGSLLDELPSDLVSIDGIEARVRAFDVYGDSGTYTEILLSHNAGTDYTTTTPPEHRNPPGSDTYAATATDEVSGGATSLYGRTWSRTDFSDANFAFRLVGRATDGYPEETRVEFIELRVYYTPAGGGSTALPLLNAYYG